MNRWEKKDSAGEYHQKRKILIVEDNELNRELLAALLEDEYDVLTAENGQIGLDILKEHYRELSVILLDVLMPVCNGYEFLERISGNPLLTSVPIIVTTGSSNQEDEEKCLNMGASDFVTKPYNTAIVRARVNSIIKLHESVATLSAVEFDELTGLYTMQAFYHHAQTVLDTDSNTEYDLCVFDIQEFKLLNGILGKRECDRILCYIAEQLLAILPAVMMARQGDKFFMLCRSEDRPEDIDFMEEKLQNLIKNAGVPGLIIKNGIYQNIERSETMSVLCDRVVMAAASVKYHFDSNIAFYDEQISERRMRNQKMEADFEYAIEHEEFQVWYQPKVDAKTERIVAAEALVRWIDKDGKLISPGAFIPLFEKDGLIYRLDEYVFRKVCELQKNRIREGKTVVPISVNLSRNSIFHEGTIEKYARSVNDCGIPYALVPIELTESAATGNRRIAELTQELSAAGFSIHMDDFGAGYSSLSILGVLPFDVIKLDKSLCDQIGNEKGDIIIRHIIGIAKELGMKVVAEGIEKMPQVEFLREAGCNMIQGFYYSPPKEQNSFENMMDQV